MIRWLCILPLYLWITTNSCYKATMYTYGPSSIRPDSESVALNILGTQNSKSGSNGFNIWHTLYRLFQNLFKGYVELSWMKEMNLFPKECFEHMK